MYEKVLQIDQQLFKKHAKNDSMVKKLRNRMFSFFFIQGVPFRVDHQVTVGRATWVTGWVES